MTAQTHDSDYTVIERSSGWSLIDVRELWEYRELIYFLTWRDVKVKYKQTVLGAAWAILQPLFAMIVFSLLFGRMAKIPSDGLPYPIFSYSGLLPWTFFSTAVSFASASLVGSANMVSKIYFPRAIVPLSATLPGLLDYVIALTMLGLMMVWYSIVPGIAVLLLPLLMLLCLAAATGVGLWLSAINVRYRDVRYVVPFVVQFWLFLSPVIYPVSMLSERYQWLLALNPMTGVIEAHRAALLGHTAIDWTLLGTSGAVSMLLLVSGAMYFTRTERGFADVI